MTMTTGARRLRRSTGGRGVAALVLLLAGLGAERASSAADSTTCHLGGPAGTASVARIHLPRSTSGIALRVTTPTTLGARSSDVVGDRSSWHLATGLTVVRVGSERIAASRFVQSGSSPRRVAVSAGGHDVRADTVAPGAPFNHVGGFVPPVLPAGDYDIVAWGADGDAAQPNPWWSAQLTVGARVDCEPERAATYVFDRDGTDFSGGTQVAAYGAGYADGTRLRLRLPHGRVVGMIDAERQLAGSVQVGYRSAAGQGGRVTDDLAGFSGTGGRYTFTADYSGAFPVALVSGVVFRPAG